MAVAASWPVAPAGNSRRLPSGRVTVIARGLYQRPSAALEGLWAAPMRAMID